MRLKRHLARSFDVIAVENLDIKGLSAWAKGTVDAPGRNVKPKAGLNRGILTAGWGQLARRLQDKAPGRVVEVNADVNAACNIRDRALDRARKTAAGCAVAARGGGPEGQPVNREPQLVRTSW